MELARTFEDVRATRRVLLVATVIAVTGVTARAQYIAPEPLAGSGTIDTRFGTVYFGPKAPVGKQSNWVQTRPGKSFNLLYRMYGPLEPWFDKTWKLGDFELVE